MKELFKDMYGVEPQLMLPVWKVNINKYTSIPDDCEFTGSYWMYYTDSKKFISGVFNGEVMKYYIFGMGNYKNIEHLNQKFDIRILEINNSQVIGCWLYGNQGSMIYPTAVLDIINSYRNGYWHSNLLYNSEEFIEMFCAV